MLNDQDIVFELKEVILGVINEWNNVSLKKFKELFRKNYLERISKIISKINRHKKKLK
jgi:hypothetical protein